MPNKAATTKQEKVARAVHRMTTSGASFDTFGKVREHELFGCAAAGVAIVHKVSLEEAKRMLLSSIE